MPINVVCPGCKARFAVSDKFAGKKGPCPKCKAVILVPAAPAVAAEEVKIHVPDEYQSAGKDAKGRAVAKPIAREETRFDVRLAALVVLVCVVVLAIAYFGRGLSKKLPLAVAGLITLAPALVVGGYAFLRDDELEPYRGRSLWVRTVLCALVYVALWGAYMPLSTVMTGELWQWLFVGPIFVAVGSAAAWGCLDLDFGTAAIHYCFFLFVTLTLRWVLGMQPIWDNLATM